MRHERGPDTRARLVSVAADAIWERSFQAASVDTLCARADARKGSFYHFFDSKTDLAIAAIRASWESVRDAIFEPIARSKKGGLDQLMALIDAVDCHQSRTMAEKGAYLGCPFGNLGQEMSHQDARIRVALKEIFDAHCVYIEGMLRATPRAQAPRPGAARRQAEAVFALLEGALLLSKVSNDPATFRRVAKTVALLVEH